MIGISRKRTEMACILGRVEEHVFVGSNYKTVIRLSSGKQIVSVQSASAHQAIQHGEEVFISFDLNKAVVLAS